MNHPTREEWMSYLYDELATAEHSGLEAHLAVCPDCKVRLGQWRAARSELDTWRLPAKPARLALARPLIQWAAAAAIVLGFGFGIGRLAATVNAQKVRAEIEPAIRQELTREFARTLRLELDRAASATLSASGEQTRQVLADYAKALETKRVEDLQRTYAALEKLESRRLADYVSLKSELDTVAVLTDAGLRQLADSTQPADFSTTPQK
jgi:anti-sigma factor RsiW